MTKLGDYMDRRFVLFDQLKIQDMARFERFADYDRETFDMVIQEAEKFAENTLWPLNLAADEEGCTFEDGQVKTPAGFKEAYDQYVEGGWLTPSDDVEAGGQGLPYALSTACHECFHGANSSFSNYPNLVHGAGMLIHKHGTEEQKQRYLTKMWSGEWAGTMCLTEPGAGSDLGSLKTKAAPQDNGTYKIEGQKMFITAGQHDLTPNIIHPVLARVEGDPPGPKGISLFIVPRDRLEDGENNDVKCVGIEHKMGLRGSATCQMSFGEDGNCVGELLGKQKEGLKIMFLMMNEERLLVATQAMGIASTAYQMALQYARERVQGRHLAEGKNPEAQPVPIIQHPDVRRMLMWMKSVTEGMRAMNYFTGMCLDMAQVTEGEEQQKWQGMVELLTPIVKAYGSDMGFRVCETAIQVHGGYGYVSEYRVEQCLRDQKITSIYEGTTGIQAMDLLGRKIPMAKGKVFEALMGYMDEAVEKGKKSELLKPYAQKVANAREELKKVATHMVRMAGGKDFMVAFLNATPLLYVVGDVLTAWQLLWQAVVAEDKLNQLAGSGDKAELIKENNEAAYLDGKIKSARFFIGTELEQLKGKIAAIMAGETAALDMAEESFS